jgi:TPR repeat protein
LATLYLHGEGVELDRTEAYKWFSLAADGLPGGEEQELARRGQAVTASQLEPEKLAAAKLQVAAFKPQLEHRESLSLQGP